MASGATQSRRNCQRCGYTLNNHHHALADAEACAAIAIKLFNHGGDPYFMEPCEIVLAHMRTLDIPVKAAQLSEMLDMERKVIDCSLRYLRDDNLIQSPKRGYWEVV